jgi:hypothetical protein
VQKLAAVELHGREGGSLASMDGNGGQTLLECVVWKGATDKPVKVKVTPHPEHVNHGYIRADHDGQLQHPVERCRVGDRNPSKVRVSAVGPGPKRGCQQV